nr:Cyclin dependent kinase 2 associated protein 2 [Hymenolepis microstoma]
MSVKPDPDQKSVLSCLDKYVRLLNIIEEMKRDIKAPYVGNKVGIERLRRNIQIARNLVQECSDELNRIPKD